jgi:hypothetical protein
MSMLPNVIKSSLVAGALIAAAGVASAANAEAVARPASKCFFSTSWRGWSSPSPDVLYLKVNLRDVYKVDLAGHRSSSLKRAGYFLVNEMHGSNTICSALDLDLAVSDGHGFYEPLIARSIRPMTPEEIAAIPKKDRP